LRAIGELKTLCKISAEIGNLFSQSDRLYKIARRRKICLPGIFTGHTPYLVPEKGASSARAATIQPLWPRTPFSERMLQAGCAELTAGPQKKPPIRFKSLCRQALGAGRAAKKCLIPSEKAEKRPSGAKALVDLIALAARLKSCPVTKPRFSAAH
jgi:hypothetical protein